MTEHFIDLSYFLGDTLGISTGSHSTVLHRVAQALCSRMRQFIKFSTTNQELTETKQGFYALNEFPNVIGAIDGTHVEIITPKKVIPVPIAYIKNINFEIGDRS